MATATIKTTENNDFYVDEFNNMVFIEGVDACAQDTRSNCLMRVGENIFNVREGVGYFEYIFAPQQSYEEARKSLATAILASPDVISIEQLTITIDGEVFNWSARVMTIYGPVTVKNS